MIDWDVDPLDWKIRNSEHVKAEILKQTVSGSIILSHDIHKTTVDAMPETLDALAAKGFKFVTVSQLLEMDRPVPPKAKKKGTPKAAGFQERRETGHHDPHHGQRPLRRTPAPPRPWAKPATPAPAAKP